MLCIAGPPSIPIFLIVNTMEISKQRSEKHYSPPLMIHHPRLYEVPEHPVPAVPAQSRRETTPIHDDTGAGTSFSENNFMTVPKGYGSHTSSSLTAAKKRGREDGPDETPFKRKRGSGN